MDRYTCVISTDSLKPLRLLVERSILALICLVVSISLVDEENCNTHHDGNDEQAHN